MLDVVNEELIKEGKEPIAFDHDCREGICGHAPRRQRRPPRRQKRTTLCQLHMRKFKDGDSIYLEPWRARAFPIIRDLVVDRGALDKLIQAAGYVSCRTGGVPNANAIPISKPDSDYAMDAAESSAAGRASRRAPRRGDAAAPRRAPVRRPSRAR